MELATFPLVGPIAVFAGGAWLLVRGVGDRDRARATAGWPTVVGRVYAARVLEERDEDGDRLFRPEVRFEYHVDGTEYASTRLERVVGAALAVGGLAWGWVVTQAA